MMFLGLVLLVVMLGFHWMRYISFHVLAVSFDLAKVLECLCHSLLTRSCLGGLSCEDNACESNLERQKDEKYGAHS